MSQHKVYFSIIYAVENGKLREPFGKEDFRNACPNLGEGTYKAFLDKHPNPTLDDVEEGLGGNLCRCGTYAGVRQAVLEVAKSMKGGATNA
jgi:hypothetical protein